MFQKYGSAVLNEDKNFWLFHGFFQFKKSVSWSIKIKKFEIFIMENFQVEVIETEGQIKLLKVELL